MVSTVTCLFYIKKFDNLLKYITVECTHYPQNPSYGRWRGDYKTVKLVCDVGYKHASGDDTKTCRGGQWTGYPPTCAKGFTIFYIIYSTIKLGIFSKTKFLSACIGCLTG